MLCDGEEGFDIMLEDCGYEVIDLVNFYVIEVKDFVCDDILCIIVIFVWEFLCIMEEIWVEGGIGFVWIEVMC